MSLPSLKQDSCRSHAMQKHNRPAPSVTVPKPGTRPLVLIDAAIPDEPLAILDESADVVRYNNHGELEALVRARGHEIVGLGTLLSTSVDASLLDRLPNLRVIANYAVGLDNVD